MNTCEVENCGGSVKAKGLCLKHYHRFRRHGNPFTRLRAANGECLKWIEDHVNYDGDKCLIWPYASGGRGDAVVLHEGRMRSGSRVMCEFVHGIPDPALELECAHSCGNGHLGCMNPKHLRWDTRSGNFADKLIHNTDNRGEKNINAILREEDVVEILRSNDSLAVLSAKYGVTKSTVSAIRTRRLWKHVVLPD